MNLKYSIGEGIRIDRPLVPPANEQSAIDYARRRLLQAVSYCNTQGRYPSHTQGNDPHHNMCRAGRIPTAEPGDAGRICSTVEGRGYNVSFSSHFMLFATCGTHLPAHYFTCSYPHTIQRRRRCIPAIHLKIASTLNRRIQPCLLILYPPKESRRDFIVPCKHRRRGGLSLEGPNAHAA